MVQDLIEQHMHVSCSSYRAFLPQPKYRGTCTQEPAYLPLSLSLCGPLGSLSLRLLDLSLDCSCDGLERSCRLLLIHKVAANRCCDTGVLVGKLCSGAETFPDLQRKLRSGPVSTDPPVKERQVNVCSTGS